MYREKRKKEDRKAQKIRFKTDDSMGIASLYFLVVFAFFLRFSRYLHLNTPAKP
jgi:hypothetical protein